MNSLQFNKQHILIIDDNLKNIRVIGTILRKTGFNISVARSGMEALQVAGKNPVDLVLLDILMPEMDGFETCRHLKENPATRDIPVIFLTALTDVIDKVKAAQINWIDRSECVEITFNTNRSGLNITVFTVGISSEGNCRTILMRTIKTKHDFRDIIKDIDVIQIYKTHKFNF